MQNKKLTEMDEKLESFMDQFGLSAVLASIENICHEKAEHVRTNYQDEFTAKEWEKLGNDLDKFQTKHKDRFETLVQ